MASRRLVLLPGQSVPPNIVAENMDTENSDTESRNSSTVSVEPNMLRSFVAKCRILIADLETSAISIDESLKEGNLTSSAIEMELAEITKMVDEYSVAHLSIIRICDSEGIDPQEYYDRRQRFLIRSKGIRNQLLSNVPASSSQKLDTPITSGLKLPRVDIPVFEGDFEQWSSWYKLFESLIHKNEELDNMKKFSFLRSRLRGAPLNLIDGFPFEGEYYEAAFSMVVNHYNDPLKRISRLLDTIQNSACMKDKKQTLRGLITLFRANVTALQITFSQNKEIDPLSQLLIHSFLAKADKGTRQDWEREMTRKKKFANFDEFIEFMEGRCNAYERATMGSNANFSQSDGSQKQKSFKVLATVSKNAKCYYCSQNHTIYKCQEFRALSKAERKKAVIDKKLCQKCLSPRCGKKCPILCGLCKKGHNILIHETHNNETSEQPGNKIFINSNNSNSVIENNSDMISISKFWIGNISNDCSETLLATTQLQIFHSKNSYSHTCRAILDSGSQLNLITKNLVKKLELESELSNVNISSVGNHLSFAKGCVIAKIFAQNTNFVTDISCEVVNDIVNLVPNHTFDTQGWNIPKNIVLADKTFNVSSEIDLLLGARIFWNTLGSKVIELGKNLPCLRSSKFGWLVTDTRDLERLTHSNGKYVLATQNLDNLSEIIKHFWFLDEFESKILSFEELECERIFSETTTRNINGSFIVRLPFGIPPQKLGHSRSQALKRFLQLEKRFKQNPTLYKEYVACIEDYLNLGHMHEIKEEKIDKNLEQPCYYIPHHAVIKETSTSTKLRAVFDASMTTSSGLSLNQCLLVGPVVQSDLLSVIMRFRIHKVVFTADITKMYRQVLLHPDDTRFQRIFWRSNFNEPIKIYEITTVAFGTASAPFLATRCIKALAELDGERFPAAYSVLLRDFYVDDVLTGASDINVALNIQRQLQEILAGAGFKLSKWCANSNQLLYNIPENECETKFPFSLNKGEKVVKTLGLLWFPIEDNFKIRVQIENFDKIRTKRHILSIIASIFDPLGLISPITIIAKLLIQQLWASSQSPCSPKSKDHWEERVSDQNWQQWIKFATNLSLLNNLSIPRYLFNNCNSFQRIELHGFSDASEKAYGAAVYIRAIGQNEFSSCLFFSKSRVAPLKHQSLPRLELCAALLLSEIIDKVKISLRDVLKVDIIRLWSDSQIVLHWIQSSSNKWLPFVANRVQKVQNLTSDCFWDYVHTKSNPADLISRGATPDDLNASNLWWKGPEWLLTLNYFTSETKFTPSKKPLDLELRHSKRSLVFVTVFKSSIFHQFSNYWKLVRIVAWISRFFWNSHWFGPQISGPLQIFELRDAIRILVRLSQSECFPVEYKRLKSNSEVDKSSSIVSLSPFLDHHNIIRVGGRLQNSELSFDQQHPFVLDPHHELSKLIIRYFHELHFHAGPQFLRSIIRNQFWILQINRAIRFCLTHCHKCIRFRAENRTQTMAALPKSRVTPNKPFSITGVDYAGPFSVLGKGGRHKVEVKSYIAVFVCFTTKAIHLEFVSDLTSEAFLAALNRFVSRRGIPIEIHSDNGTNFVGTKNLLKKHFKEFMASNFDKISKFTANKGCQWNFIPPQAPHFGGLWEAGVKSVKGQLRSVLSKNTFTFEQWTTLLAQIEACLNSRPLIPESNDPNELSALTPGHFLIGGPILAIPHPDLKDIPSNRLKHWSLVKSVSQRFWQRWSNEYLNTLQQRSKWRLNKDAVKINDLVIIREKNNSPTSWPLGRIEKLHPGSDGHIRVVTLRTASGQLIRPIVKIIPLPTE